MREAKLPRTISTGRDSVWEIVARCCLHGVIQLGQTMCSRASICGCQGECDEDAMTAAEGCRTGRARRRWVR